jgi:hypothetical protein
MYPEKTFAGHVKPGLSRENRDESIPYPRTAGVDGQF